MLSRISSVFIVEFTVRAEQMCYNPLGPIRLFLSDKVSIVVVYSIN